MMTSSSQGVDNNALADQYLAEVEAEMQKAFAAIDDYAAEEKLLAPFQDLINGYNNATENWDANNPLNSKTYWDL